ncbi:MAG TPA: helix-turn-helix transcriptional regulator [Candidatus Coproplasma stercoravium]|nr:helix-turn-helix transcriptional regulator [Candidatus Coproplasma stercoravium]
MNKIVYAGSDARRTREFAAGRKYWQFIKCAARGEVKCAKGNESFMRGNVLAIPPLTDFERTGENAADIYIFMEGTALPFKSPKAVCEESRGGLAHAFLQAANYFERGDEKSAAVLSALGDLIISYIIAQTRQPACSPVVESVKADIEANVSNSSYALDAFIRTLPLNYDYVRKLFKSETGITPHEYLISRRMELAGRLILSGMSNQYSRYSISQIAEMCGFSEPLYFSRVFKKYFGTPPSEYGK